MDTPMFFYHDLVKLFIDDDSAHLSALKTIFGSQNIYCSNITEARVIIKGIKTDRFLESCFFQQEEVFQLLRNYISNRDKNKQVAVVVSDYDFKEKESGLDLLAQIKDNVFKILYTGVADEKIAVEAFNNGIINGYFKKSESPKKLLSLIEQGNKRYFKSATDKILPLIEKDTLQRSAFKQPLFQDFFNKIIMEYKIESFYLLDQYGSYLLLDKSCKVYTLLIMPISTITAQVEILKELSLSFWLEDILKKRKLLYLNMPNANYRSAVFNCKTISLPDTFLYTIEKENCLNIKL